MFKSKLFWIAMLVVGLFALWRWQQRRSAPGADSVAAPALPPEPQRLTPPPARPSVAGGAAAGPATGPRRIVTRVHKGAPPDAARRGGATEAEGSGVSAADTTAESGSAGAVEAAPAFVEEPYPLPKPGKLEQLAGTASAAPAEPGEPLAPEQLSAIAEARSAAEEPPAGAEVAAPGEQESREEPADGAAKAPEGVLININTASLEDLIELPGIGATLARRIIEHREAHGPFSSIEHFVDAIPGIGRRNIEEFAHLVTV